MSSRPRVLVIGLDAADRDLVLGWAEAGILPAFATLRHEALHGVVRNPDSLEAGSAWPSFSHGSDPSVHGQFDGVRCFDPATYEHVPYSPRELPSAPLWSLLGDAGKYSVLVDVPYVALPITLHGSALLDWMAHAPSVSGSLLEPVSIPAGLVAEIEKRFGPDPLGGRMCDIHGPRGTEALERFTQALIRRVEMKTEACLDLMAAEPWDFFMTVFADAHCAGHHAWHVHDARHPDHDPAIAERVGDPIERVYRALDRAVTRLLATRDDRTVVVYLSHGMEAAYSGTRLLDRILARLEGLEIDGAQPVRDWLRAVWHGIPPAARRALAPLYASAETARRAVFGDGFLAARRSRRFFEVFSNDRSGGVRINLRGREVEGRVRPGPEYEALCEQLVHDLGEVVNAETGEPVASRIVRLRDLYDGPRLGLLPDLAVTWNRSAPINVVASPKIGRLIHRYKGIRSGDHRPDGYFFALGPGIRARHLPMPTPAIDFAPTIAAWLGVDPSHFCGRPIGAMEAV